METALWEEAAKRTDDTSFGIHTAERLQPGQFDVLDYVIRTAPTPRVAVERVVRYNRLEHDIAVFSIADRGPITRVEHAFGDGRHVQSRFFLASSSRPGTAVAGMPGRRSHHDVQRSSITPGVGSGLCPPSSTTSTPGEPPRLPPPPTSRWRSDSRPLRRPALPSPRRGKRSSPS